MRCLVTGCAGFIGSHLTDRLLQEGHEVVGIDNFSTGFHENLVIAKQSARFQLHQIDLLNKEAIQPLFNNIDFVFHFAANADVRFGTDHPHKDLEQNTLVTFHVLEAMRLHQVKRIVFASTGSIYGEAQITPTPESAPFPVQTSLYGASKLAAEGLIQAYCEGFNFQSYLFRFVSILGERYSHGHVFDFYQQLLKTPTTLNILGNGMQRKSYLHVQDAINAILLAVNQAQQKINIYNLGVNEYCAVNDSIQWICEHLQLSPELIYAGGERGWVGDNPFIFLDIERISLLGWKPLHTIKQSIISTLTFLQGNPWILSRRTQ